MIFAIRTWRRDNDSHSGSGNGSDVTSRISVSDCNYDIYASLSASGSMRDQGHQSDTDSASDSGRHAYMNYNSGHSGSGSATDYASSSFSADIEEGE